METGCGKSMKMTEVHVQWRILVLDVLNLPVVASQC
jgi:hypothetical protein